MQQSFQSDHFTDKDGTLLGGVSSSTGITVSWQNGPLGRGDERQEPNGAFVETVIAIAVDRLEFYQRSKFKSDYNEQALEKLRDAIAILNERTKDRESRQVEGTHTV